MNSKQEKTTGNAESITKLQKELEKYKQEVEKSRKTAIGWNENTLRLEGAVFYIEQLMKEEQNGSKS